MFQNLINRQDSICVVGLGYVGLPLAAALARCFKVIGFDINSQRINELKDGFDRTEELDDSVLHNLEIAFSSDAIVLSQSKFIIVTVPTPIDQHRQPDLTPLTKASRLIGQKMIPGSTVVFESTVYPGCTEEVCIPEIEAASGLKWGQDFFVGYSPERINPGDREHTVQKIKKIVSGDTPETLKLVSEVYGTIISAGLHCAPNIKTAEAAKVIENTQRDLNIALMNELAMIFDRQGIRTLDVLEAAGTKWNFLPFRPGLVGGHCIGVDPYYLTHKAESLGYHPQVILAGRRINDSMGKFIAEKTIKTMISHGCVIKGAKVLILGWTFKENVPDVRNTRVIDIYQELESYGVEPVAYDPNADAAEVLHEYKVDIKNNIKNESGYDAVVLAVKHKLFLDTITLEQIKKLGGKKSPIVIDVKGFYSPSQFKAADLLFWQL